MPHETPPRTEGRTDARLYVPQSQDWTAHVKQGWEKLYCHSQAPGEDHFHLLLNGEIYLERDGDKYCLNCALQHGIITDDRLYWQRSRPGTRRMLL